MPTSAREESVFTAVSEMRDDQPVANTPISQVLADRDPSETAEWVESLEAVVREAGPVRAAYLLRHLVDSAREEGVDLPPLVLTDPVNTIAADAEPAYPGDDEIEDRIEAVVRWNAAAIVARANRPGWPKVDGHLSTFASSALLYEVGYNHFFRGKDADRSGDQIYFQGHGSPGMYSRAFLEGRLSADQLDGFRHEFSGPAATGGIPSYPHPRAMPDFWEFPTVSMGIGPLDAIYQARFNKYLTNRGIKDTSNSTVWAFLGDGETDEVDTLGALGIAARDGLDNLVFVVNCNLQRLDGPVRGNGSVVRDLEGIFRGAGWNVIKVMWGASWDPLFARDTEGVLTSALANLVDGQLQTYTVSDGGFIRADFFARDPRLLALVDGMGDAEIEALMRDRGGLDRHKIYAAYDLASRTKGVPSVILAQTIKGWKLGYDFEARNATHQMKKMTVKQAKDFRDRLGLAIPDSTFEPGYPPYYHPGTSSAEVAYANARRAALAGPVPARRVSGHTLPEPPAGPFEVFESGSGHQPVATTMAAVRLLKDLMRDKEIGPRFVPITPDEARTFGLEAIFPSAKIYSVHGQKYDAVDRDLLLSYKESTSGQILHEGISEAGSMASTIATGTSYATHGEPMIPFYIFYSMFGFQRTADFMWAFADQLGRGFLLGATAGRTTLNGEGLQHQDGHSPILAATNPAAMVYDPAFAYEIATIMRTGLRRMYGASEAHPHGEDIFYYLTVYNEPYLQPARPEGVTDDQICAGIYRFRGAELDGDRPVVNLLASGTSIQWALAASDLLASEYGVGADVWSVTSWTELRRDALAADRDALLHPGEGRRIPYLTRALAPATGPFIAVSDYMRQVPDQIAQWVPGRFTSLGTDGFGAADTRAALRRHFAVDAESITVAALGVLAEQGSVKPELVADAAARLRIDDPKAASPEATTEEE